MSIFYADRMCQRVVVSQNEQQRQYQQHHRNPSGHKFVVTEPICLAINNIDFVLEFVKPFVTEELGTEDTLKRLEATSGPIVAKSCRRTLKTLVINTIDLVENKILEVLDIIGEKVQICLRPKDVTIISSCYRWRL